MLIPAARRLNRGRVSNTASIPAPIGGWNARDSLAEMKETDAVILDNIFPTTNDVMVRYGYTNHVTGITGTVETLGTYNGGATQKMFAAAGTSIYDATSAGSVGAAKVTGLTNARFQTVNITTSGGNYMYWVNGADKPQLYDGTNWTAIDGVSVPAITGVTTTNLITVNLHMHRLWFIEKNTLKVWYLPTDAVGGAAASVDLSGIARRGGYLMAMGTWTIDAGYGMDDHAVFVTSEGEIIVYRGSDPAGAATWSLVGVYYVGSPIGRRALSQYGSDLLVIGKDGLLPMSKALLTSRVNTRVALTDKIQWATSQATSDYATNFGWQAQIYPQNNMLLLNVPVSSTVSYQYVMNTITGAWCRFTGWNAACFELLADNLYFGTSGTVCKAWNTQADNGISINGEVLQAFSYFGNQNALKQFKMARPILSTDGNPGVLMGLNVDFDTSSPTGTPLLTPISAAAWDSGVWDTGVWGGGLQINQNWQYVSGLGRAGAIHMKTLSNSKLRWTSTDYIYEFGGLV